MPIIPNFIPGVGRLATDEYDFQKHIDGYSFRHQAGQIDLSPSLIISSQTYTNVQSAIAALTTAVNSITVPPATNTVLGSIKLAGDLNGLNTNANAPIVGGLQGRPIQNLAPTSGQFLGWNGSSWTPTNANAFTAGNNLSGTSTSQNVIGLTGSLVGGLHVVNSTADTLQFSTGAQPLLTQASQTSNIPTNNMVIAPQAPFASATGSNLAPASLLVQFDSPFNVGIHGFANEPQFLIERLDTFHSTTQGVFSVGAINSSTTGMWFGVNALPAGRQSFNYNIAVDGLGNTILNAPVTDDSAGIVMSNDTTQLLSITADSSSYTTTNIVSEGNLALTTASASNPMNFQLGAGNTALQVTQNSMLYSGTFSSTNATISQFAWQSNQSVNTQLLNYQVQPWFFSTSGTTPYIINQTVSNNHGTSMEVWWSRRNIVTHSYGTGKSAIDGYAISGSVTFTGSNIYVTGNATTSDALPSSSGNNLQIYFIGQGGVSYDWQVILYIQQN